VLRFSEAEVLRCSKWHTSTTPASNANDAREDEAEQAEEREEHAAAVARTR
jgi:hypothetical protein